ncbi:hypothetical protein FZEAL_3863 [Fusarium zealandicum]|uniref:Uncharacterized protein n=1 Tax=Fusarium zealandicum TaxID=1053134 RepID=A0A8H4XLC7_9HYPO|nr:hypothetical protein FZEAL_3863 [Fusarium zealandicum]
MEEENEAPGDIPPSMACLRYLCAIEGLCFPALDEELLCSEIEYLLGGRLQTEASPGTIEGRVNDILEVCERNFMAMSLSGEEAFWVRAVGVLVHEWVQAVPPYSLMRLVGAIIMARFNFIQDQGNFDVPDNMVACNADILLFNTLLYSDGDELVLDVDWGVDFIVGHLEASRDRKRELYWREHGTTAMPDDIVTTLPVTGQPNPRPGTSLAWFQERYEAWVECLDYLGSDPDELARAFILFNDNYSNNRSF